MYVLLEYRILIKELHIFFPIRTERIILLEVKETHTHNFK